MHFHLADLFESLAAAIPEREALVCGDRRLTFAELDARANRLAHALLARGLRPGDHIGLYLYNGCEFIEAMLAAFKIRAVPINVNYRYVEDELRHLFRTASLRAVIHQRELSARVASATVPSIRTIVYVEDGSRDAPVKDSRAYEALLASGSPTSDFAARSPDDLYIIFTGGTTGMPRGVMWRQEDLFFAGLQGGSPGGDPITQPEQLAENARDPNRAMTMMPAAPFIHGAAQFAVFIALLTGGKGVIAPGARFDADLVWQLVEREHVNTLLIVGDAMARPLAESLARAKGQIDTSSLVCIASSGAILSATVRQQLQLLLPNVLVLNNFGASETGHQGSAYPMEPAGEAPRPRLRFYMDETSAVLDEQLRPVTPGSGVVGRLARRGRVPLGYFNDPEKTAETFFTVGGVRWVVPGDLATVEEDGAITVLGRGAVCINSGGEKIFPEEVEEALKAHPAIADAVVVGVPDERFGERVAAVVQTQAGLSLSLGELSAHCRTRIAGYKVPRELHLVSEVVRHPSGKPDYRWAKATALARAPDETRGQRNGSADRKVAE